MDDSKKIRDFELILQKQTCKKPSSLYNNVVNTKENTYKPQDVVQSVYSQIKAMQMADTQSLKSKENLKKSNFLSVDKMPVYAAPNPSKFETQCVSDTQLIDLVEGVEAITTNTGVTQEFDTTFAPNVCDNVGENIGHTIYSKVDTIGCKVGDNVYDKVNENTHLVGETAACKVGDNIVYNVCHNVGSIYGKDCDTIACDVKDNIDHKVCDNVGTSNGKDGDTIGCKVGDNIGHIVCEKVDIFSDKLGKVVGEAENITMYEMLPSNTNINITKDSDTLADKQEDVCDIIGEKDTKTIVSTEIEVLSQILPIKPKAGNSKEFSTPFTNDKICNIMADTDEAMSQILPSKANISISKEFDTTFDKDKDCDINKEILSQILPINKAQSIRKDIKRKEVVINESEDIESLTETEKVAISQMLKTEYKRQGVMKNLDNTLANRNISDTEVRHIEENIVTLHERNIMGVSQEFDSNSTHNRTKTKEKVKESQVLHRKAVHNDSVVEDLSDFEDWDENFVQSQILQIKVPHKDKTRDTRYKEQEEIDNIKAKEFNNVLETGYTGETNNKTDLNMSPGMNNVKEQNKESTKIMEVEYQNDEIIKLVKLDSNTKSSSNESTSILAKANVEILTSNSQDLERREKVEKNNNVNHFKEDERFDNFNDSETQRPKSPVFKTTTRSKSQHLIVPLETFEQFENIAVPIIQHNLDITATKQIINSQIIGKELVLNVNIERNDSPVLEFSDELKVKSEDLNKEINENNKAILRDEIARRSSDIPKDEILFSSDEETEIHNKIQDIPLTVALNHLDDSLENIFDDPDQMFVGFQTASNKSIQINTNSFEKAKEILDDKDNKINKELSLTELVDKMQKAKPKDRIKAMNTNKISKANDSSNIRPAVKNTRNSDFTEYTNYDKVNKKANFQGFTTANNKKINMSKKAMEKCKNVFKDINLNENYDANEKIEKDNVENDILSKTDKKEHQQELIDENFDELMLQELDNIETSLEEEKANLKQSFDEKDKNGTHEDTKADEKPHNKLETPKKSVKYDEHGKCKTPVRKNVNLSPEALAKVESFLQDIDFEICLEDSRRQSKKIKQQENKSKANPASSIKSPGRIKSSRLMKIFENVQKNNEDVLKEPVKGLKNANNRNIGISKQTSATTKNIFKEIDPKENFNHNIKVHHDDNTSHNKGFVGFKTANNKAIKISEVSLSKTKNIFKDIDNIPLEGKKFTKNNFENKSENYPFEKPKPSKENTEFETTDDTVMQDIAKDIFKDNNDIQNNEKPNFVGFMTASNKNVQISEQALMRSKRIFKDIDKEEITKPKSNKSYENAPYDIGNKAVKPFIGFQTASKKPVQVSKDYLAKSRKVFENIDKGNENLINSELLFDGFNVEDKQDAKETRISKEILEKGIENTNFIGFKTASNKTVNISDEALAKSKNLFENIDNELNNYKNYTNFDKPKCGFKGFQTASNKNVNISEVALAKSKKIFEDIDIEQNTKEIDKNFDTNTHNTVFKGFQTASKKNVKISEEALAKTKKIFENIGYEDEHDHNFDIASAKRGFKGFQTASNKDVNISKEALAKTKKIFDDIGYEDKEGQNIDIASTKVGFKGFQTASNKNVKISEEALAKTKKIFENSGEAKEDQNIDITSTKGGFKGFQTASNKNVKISEEALAKTKKIFENIGYEAKEEQNIDIASTKGGFKGFQTASNKNVKISEEASAKTKKIFENIDIETQFEEKDLNVDNSEKAFKGFQTASNKNVKISEEALAKTNKIFEDLELCNEGKDTNFDSPKSVFKGFQTASKKNVKISEEALQKSKNIFDDIDLHDKEGNTHINKRDTAKKHFDKEHKIDETKETSKIDVDNIINTQVLNNFETSLCTEDFHESPKAPKRSGSPILSCPKAKRKKFETPYSTQKKIINFDETNENLPKNEIKFTENYKKEKKYRLKDLHFEKDVKIDLYITHFNLDNILEFQFDNERNDFLQKSPVTVEDIKTAFTEGTNKKLIPNGWLDNHLKLILWKLISYETKFPSLGKVCTVKNVIDQLKYRYDRELYNAERPILRKILEKDDVSTNCIVFCVADIFVDGVRAISVTNQTNIELLLTDGWYFIKATIDKMLSRLVYEKKITVGSKIITEGAELMNCEQGVSPWEDTSSVRLSITGNSTRPARWDTKLGLRPVRIRSTLATVKPDGGKVRRLVAYVTRQYPLLYVEKFDDGSTVTRSERLEHLYQMKYEREREAMIEKIYEEVGKEFEQDSQDSEDSCSSNKRKAYETGSQIAKMMKKSKDPMEFRAQLTTSQAQNLQEHTNKMRDAYISTVQERVRHIQVRQYVTLYRTRVVGDCTTGMMSVWKPNDAVLDILKEGNWFEVINVVPTGIRNSEIQISAGRQSVFRKIKKQDEINEPYLQTLKRTCYTIENISQNPNMTTAYNEIDTVGFIFSIEPSNGEFESNKTQFQNVYLADVDKNMICVNFWGGIKKFGFENVLDTGQVFFCGNLQKRSGNTRRNIPQYRATEFSIFTKSPKNVKARDLIEEFNKKLHGLDRRRFCEDCVAIKQNYSILKCFDSENVTPYRFHNNSAYNVGKHKMLIETPKNVKKDEFDLSGLDFESTFRQPETQELSPKTLLRKKQVKDKIARLKMYGEPPPLSPMNIINISKNAANSYKSPLQKNNSVAIANKSVASPDLNDATPTKKPSTSAKNSEGSPIISMSRTCVKRVNPVKLNFGSVAMEENDNTDHFAEDFDGSPPLSLE